MNKKVLSLIVLFTILMTTFCGCGGKSSSAVSQDNATGTNQTEQTLPDPANVHTVISTPTPEPEPTPEPTPSVEVEWQTLTYQWEDNSGYTFEATVKISPWINTKNTDYVTAAWNEVGNGKTIPDFDPNERAYYNGKCGFDGITNLTDMYYCIGELTVKNITPDWSISSDNPIISQDVCLSPVQKADENSTSVRNSRTIAKVTYSNEVKSNYTWAIISPKLTSDNWGPVPFVFAHYDRKTPKYPNGEYSDEMTDTVFCISNVHYSRIYSSTVKINLIEES